MTKGHTMVEERIKLGTLARVQARPNLDAEALLQIARDRAPDASVFDDVHPFFWQVRASSNRLDFYDTRMRAGDGKTLDNFARGLAAGVSYQDSHKTFQNGWGQSLTGRVVETDETDPEINEPIVEVYGELFTIPGLDLAGQSTDSMIAAIRAGVWRDVSVGFYASDIECSICGKQSFQWWKEDGCQHIPGYEYTFEDLTARAFAWINDGELVELSQVYKGASPSAAVLKAEQMNEEGRLSEGERAFIERRHGVRILEPAQVYALGSIQRQVQEDIMPEERNQELTGKTRETIVKALEWAARRTEAGAWEYEFDSEKDSLGDAVARFVSAAMQTATDASEHASEVRRIADERDQLQARIAELEPQAKDGKRYRADLIDDTLAAGARAHGQDFREDMYRGLLENASIEHIRGMKDDFTKQGDAIFARQLTVEQDETEGGRNRTETDPDRYRA